MDTLSTFWKRIQRSLIPDLEEELGPLTDKQKQLVAILEIIRVEDFVSRPITGFRGCVEKDRRAIARAFIAKMVYNLPRTRQLIEHITNDSQLRRICGWETRRAIPGESTFSRAFAAFAKDNVPSRVHAAMIEKYEKDHLVGHLSKDSTAIEAREKPVRREKQKRIAKSTRRGRPRKGEERPLKELTRLERQVAGMPVEEMVKELPIQCDVGTKRNSKGYKKTWVGYKLHVDWADGDIPVSCLLTSASLHDSQAAIPLMVMSQQRVTSLYDVMDSAYDAPEIKDMSRAMNHVPLIDHNPRRGQKVEFDPATAVRYNERSTAERGFSHLKDTFGGSNILVRGHAKVFAHLMFGILAVTAVQLLRQLVT